MRRLLHIDASPRPGRSGVHEHGSHTRRLTHRFVSRWRAARPGDEIRYRDIGAAPPRPVSGPWIQAAFTPEDRREPWMAEVLSESDLLTDELVAADVLVLGVPMYNFGVPAPVKAWIDNVVRLDRTVAYDPDRPEDPYIPRLADRPRWAVLLSSRGGFGFDEGGALAHMNHLEPSLRTVLGFMGITRVRTVAIEYQEAGGELLAGSIRRAEAEVDGLVRELLADAVAVSDPLATV
ncbi:MAG: NAD(P)H-dependent oxidoreductase [Ectothiorhodospiraceae bacterium]|nr:NAD(P)H-dependent oxidoreductase [Ectothiorhodospiraceae bacterium]